MTFPAYRAPQTPQIGRRAPGNVVRFLSVINGLALGAWCHVTSHDISMSREKVQ